MHANKTLYQQSSKHSRVGIVVLCAIVVCFSLGSILTVTHFQGRAQREVESILILQALIQQVERLGRVESRMTTTGTLPIEPLETLVTETDDNIALLAERRPVDAASVRFQFDAYAADLRATALLVSAGRVQDAAAARDSTTLVSGAAVLTELTGQYRTSQTRELAAMRNAKVALIAAITVGTTFICGVMVIYDQRRKRAYSLLVRQENWFRSLIQQSTDIILVADIHGTISYATPAAEHALGLPANELTNAKLASFVVPEDRETIRDLLLESIAGDGIPAECEARFFLENGRIQRTVEVVAVNLIENEAVKGIVITAHDITERKLLLESLHHRAYHDSLTGLPNRLLLAERLQGALNRSHQSGAPVSVLFIDLDDFKQVNDREGHGAGDDLLIAAASKLRSSLRAEDLVARIGGDEFIVVVENADRNQSVRLAERLSNALTGLQVRGRDWPQRASIGIYVSSADDALPAETVVKLADSAMYAVKSAGKTGWHVFGEPEPATTAVA